MSTCVYFIEGATSGAIKIGTTKNLHARMSSMQTASVEPLTVLGTVNGGVDLERKLHMEFAGQRVRGEWFRSTPELRARIKELCSEVKLLRRMKAPSADPHTVLARHWAEEVEAVHRADHSAAEAAKLTAEEFGLAPGFLENLERGRIEAISARDFEVIRDKSLSVLQCRAEKLTAFLARLKSEPRQ